jgi:prepilin-type processing-associated H-X9-DG protein
VALDIYGIGTAVPEHTMTLSEAVSMSTGIVCRDRRETRLMQVMLRRAGVENRHTCVPHQLAYQWTDAEAAPGSSPGPTTQERMAMYTEHAGPLAVEACTRALNDAAATPDDISHLITVSCTGFGAPGVDIQLIEELGLSGNTERLHIGYMGCHGAINGLRAAMGLAAQPDARVLVCAIELCSLHYRYQWDAARVLGNVLFADGSAAIVGGPACEDRKLVGQVQSTGSCLIPDSQDAMTWHIGDHGFEMTLSSRVPKLIRTHLEPWLCQWLDSCGLSITDIASWAVHPGGPRILDAVEQSLELDEHALGTSRGVLKQFGNMSSPTLIFILQRLLTDQAARPCVALGFGPGLIAEAALVV